MTAYGTGYIDLLVSPLCLNLKETRRYGGGYSHTKEFVLDVFVLVGGGGDTGDVLKRLIWASNGILGIGCGEMEASTAGTGVRSTAKVTVA